MQSNQVPVKKRRSACYARVSTDMQSGGLESQIRALRLYCEQNKIDDFDLYVDENQSGTKQSRPALDRMMAAVESDEIDNVIVFAFSRYARSVSHMLKGLEVMRKHKTNFISLTERLDLNTSLGHVIFVILSALAQLERDLIAERVKNGIANARAKGRQIGRKKTRNSALIRNLLEAGLPYRKIAVLAKCSHGSVYAEVSAMRAEKAAASEKARIESEEQGKLVLSYQSQPHSTVESEVNPSAS